MTLLVSINFIVFNIKRFCLKCFFSNVLSRMFSSWTFSLSNVQCSLSDSIKKNSCQNDAIRKVRNPNF